MLTAPILTVEQAAAMAGCDAATISAKCAARELPGVKFGRGWVLPAEAFFETMNELGRQWMKKPAPPAPAAVLQQVPRRAPPALPTSDAQPGPRRGARRTAAPSLVTTTP